ncbi:MAG: ribbon-helix-helix domain-containing protein [Calothrix sp. FI2-JRJ7]|jgi:predicted DNA-binding protein|nr:ribbon-helix-helix domain-containing protein [Calothrix sp. FI2-JRJ7]
MPKNKFLAQATSVRFLPHQLEQLENISEEYKMSIAALIREAVKEFCEHKKASA